MPKVYTAGKNVYQAAKERLREHYEAGDRVVISTSGGKDSTVVMELAIEVARETNRLPVEVMHRDEEIMAPGTFEYLERVYHRPEVELHWCIAGQAIINAYNRYQPYWWVFDPDEKDKWVRPIPPQAQWIENKLIEGMTSIDRFPVNPGNRLVAVTGLRAAESITRLARIASTRGALTKHPTAFGAYTLAPIYDWQDDDVWTYIKTKGIDYNEIYNALYRIGVPKRNQRIAPPTMRQGITQLPYLQKLYPQWFDKVNTRCPGTLAAAYYGKKSLYPLIYPGQTWQDVMYWIIEDADQHAPWLAKRCRQALHDQEERHKSHSNQPLPMTRSKHCRQCLPKAPGSWEALAKTLYNGDPWSHYNQDLPPLEPEEVKPGTGYWAPDGKKGKMTW